MPKIKDAHCRQDGSQGRGRAEKACQHRRGLTTAASMWKEFKEFAVKGNAIDLAVGVIIGAAFGGIVNSLVKDILMPPIGLLTGGLDFSNKFIVLKDAAGGEIFATPAEAVRLGRDHVELRQLHHAGDQFHHRGVLHFPRRASGQQDEATVAGRPRRSRRIVRPAR